MPDNVNQKVASSPFTPAASRPKPLKMLLWGASGTGKTTLALQFPSVVLIDMEGSADLYGDKFKYDVIRSNNVQQVRAGVPGCRNAKLARKLVDEMVQLQLARWTSDRHTELEVFKLENE